MTKHICHHSGIEFETKEVDINKIIHLNQRLNFVLGYTIAFLSNYEKLQYGEDNKKYQWIIKSVENICDLSKPLSPIP